MSISKGKHLFVAGVDVLRQYWYVDTDWAALPIIGFGGGPQGQFTGNGFSDFLLGDMASIYQDGGALGSDSRLDDCALRRGPDQAEAEFDRFAWLALRALDRAGDPERTYFLLCSGGAEHALPGRTDWNALSW